MEMVTVKTNKQHRRNKKVQIAGVSIEFDDFLIAEVPERYVEKLLDAGLEIVGDEDVKKYAEEKAKLEERRANEPKSAVDVYDENAKLKLRILELEKEIEILKSEDEEGVEDGLNGLDLKALQDLCKTSKLPKKEWGELKEDELRTYLNEEINKQENKD